MVWRRKRRTVATAKTTVTVAPTATTTLTIAPAPPTTILRRRGDYMGISAGSGASTRVLDACVELGVKWVRVSHELGWTNTIANLQTTVTAAHSRGLKVLQCIQKAGHTYSNADAQPLTDFALACAATGIDALEIGNEWNNGPFFQPTTLPPTIQATLSAYVSPRVRAQYPNLPIITNGLSPAPGNYTTHLFWPAFWDAASLANKAAGYTAQGLHPYVFPEDPLGLVGHPEWNPWWALPIIRDAMTLRGIGDQQVWFTEVGAPGDKSGALIIRNIVCDETNQAWVTQRYLQQWINQGRPDEPIFIHTAFDGDGLSGAAADPYFGLYRSDGTKKPAWQIVHDIAAQVIT